MGLSLPLRIVAVQGVIAVTAAVVLLTVSSQAAYAAALAGFAIVFPNAWFAWRLHDTAGHREAPDAQQASEGAQLTLARGVQKTLLTLLLVVGLFILARPEPLVFIGTMILLHGAFFLTPLLDVYRRRPSR